MEGSLAATADPSLSVMAQQACVEEWHVPGAKTQIIMCNRCFGAAGFLLTSGPACACTVCAPAQDPAKRAWVEGLQDDVVYVSGRVRKPGEMNGKSGNLNFCAAQLYPKARRQNSPCSVLRAACARFAWCMQGTTDADA